MNNLIFFDSFLQNLRQFFHKRGYQEVITPLMSPYLIPESYLDFFETSLKLPDGKVKNYYLTPSPELWHKRLLAKYQTNIFEIGPRFRNGDVGKLHKPEFLLLEWYHLGATIFQTMEETQELITYLAPQKQFFYRGMEINLRKPFIKLSMKEAFKKYLGIDDLFNIKVLKRVGQGRGLSFSDDVSWEELFNLIYVSEIEPRLGLERPTFIYNFPAQFAPLAKKDPQDERFKQRFELFIAGLELADGYSELTDPIEQKLAFEKEIEIIKKGKRKLPRVDWDFIEVIKKMPPSSGVALGIERLLMLFRGMSNINEASLINLHF